MREKWSAVRCLLVACLEPPAEVIAAAPAVRMLRQALPEAAMRFWVRSPACADAAALIGMRDCLVAPLDWARPANLEAVAATLRRQCFDAAFFFTSRQSSPFPAAYLCYLAGVPIRVGQANLFGGRVLSDTFPRPKDNDIVADYLALVEAAGLTTASAESANSPVGADRAR